jgi:hypothetical protein
VEISTPAIPSPKVCEGLTREHQARRRISIAYLLSVAIPGLLLSATWLLTQKVEISASRLIALTGIITSVAIPMISVSLALPFWRGAIAWVSLVLVSASLVVLVPMGLHVIQGAGLDSSLAMNAIFFLQLGAIQLTFPFLLMFATGVRKLRGIAPLILGLISLLGLVPFIGTKLTELFRASLGGPTGEALATSASSIEVMVGFYMSFFLLAPAAGWLTWRVLHRIANRFEEKRFSDSQLVAYSWWLIFVVTFASGLLYGVSALWTLLVCGIIVALFPVLNYCFLLGARKHGEEKSAPILLLLRVFMRGSRIERFADRVVGRWRLIGPVSVISAPDIVTRTVGPADVLRLVSGRANEKFVDSQSDLERKLLNLDLRADPDGRYRVNEFWCRDNSWQAAVVRLMDRCDVIVVDVRGLAIQHTGIGFELEQLAARLPAERIVLVVDKHTDRRLIATAMANGHGALKLVCVERDSASEMEMAFNALLEAARTQVHPPT